MFKVTATGRARGMLLRAVATLAVVATIGVSAVGGWVAYLQLSGNVHAVEAGEVYRSNTLSPSRLAEVLAGNGIRTVLNLRGAEPQSDWYRQEQSVVAEAGATLIDLQMSSTSEPSDDLVSKLVEIMRTAPRPLLIHCRAGADRTGLASALYELLIEHKKPDEAAGQLSFWYGHFPWLRSDTAAMDRTFWRIANQGLPRPATATQ